VDEDEEGMVHFHLVDLFTNNRKAFGEFDNSGGGSFGPFFIHLQERAVENIRDLEFFFPRCCQTRHDL